MRDHGAAGQGRNAVRDGAQPDRAPQIMASMMGMARWLGAGDVISGMTRLMDMMGLMGQGGMMPRGGRQPSK